MNKETLYYITNKYATYGIIERNGKVYKAAPIATYLIGKDINYALSYLKRRFNSKILKILKKYLKNKKYDV